MITLAIAAPMLIPAAAAAAGGRMGIAGYIMTVAFIVAPILASWARDR